MTGELAHITRCLDLVEADIVSAIVDRERTQALLAHLAAISAPNTGAAKVLLVLARMATTACAWIDGDLAIDVVDLGRATRVELATELGGGLRERVFAPLIFPVPFEEFTRAIERVPHMIAPLRIGPKTPRRLGLLASAVARRTSHPPPPIEIAPESLFLRLDAPPLPAEPDDDDALGSLPVILAVPPSAKPAAPRGVSDAPARDVDSGWDDDS
jgi:hypothetical protein